MQHAQHGFALGLRRAAAGLSLATAVALNVQPIIQPVAVWSVNAGRSALNQTVK